jgi:dTDP-4-dehydrorhamnose reductase
MMVSDKPTVLATGLNGLVGSKIAQATADQFKWVNLDLSDPLEPVDITDQTAVSRAFDKHPDASFVLHLAAFTDVTAAWKQQGDKEGLAYRVNVTGTENIVKACADTTKHLIHISTAYVFDGDKPDLYLESDRVNPIEWYGYTKAQAEAVVQASSNAWTILRIDQPFRSDPFPRQDIVRRIAQGLRDQTLPPQFIDHTFGPTYIDDLAKVVLWVMQSSSTGIYHTTAGEQWSDYDFASTLSKILGLKGELKPGSLEEYLKKTDRPYQKNTAMSHAKLAGEIDFQLKTVVQALEEITQIFP